MGADLQMDPTIRARMLITFLEEQILYVEERCAEHRRTMMYRPAFYAAAAEVMLHARASMLVSLKNQLRALRKDPET